MRRSLPGINYELAAAVREVNALYFQIPESYRPDATGEAFQNLEREIDRRCGAGDREGALLAIEAWRDHTKRVMCSALLYAPAGDGEAT